MVAISLRLEIRKTRHDQVYQVSLHQL